MKIDSNNIGFTKSLKRLYEKKKTVVSGLNRAEIWRIFKQLFNNGYQDAEPYYQKLEAVLIDERSNKKIHMFYMWKRIPDRNEDENRFLEIRSFKKLRR